MSISFYMALAPTTLSGPAVDIALWTAGLPATHENRANFLRFLDHFEKRPGYAQNDWELEDAWWRTLYENHFWPFWNSLIVHWVRPRKPVFQSDILFCLGKYRHVEHCLPDGTRENSRGNSEDPAITSESDIAIFVAKYTHTRAQGVAYPHNVPLPKSLYWG